MFEKLKSFVGNVGRKMEEFGDKIGSERISKLGRKIQEKCANKVASERSYDKAEANIYTTERLNEILVSFSEGYFQQANAIEKNCVHIVQEYYDKLITLLGDIPCDIHNTANLKALKKAKSRISKMIMGSIKEPLAKRMSLDDYECLDILKMDAGTEKKQAMTFFTNKVINEALDNLAKNVRESLNDQIEDIQEYLNSVYEEQEKSMQMIKNHFDKMVNKQKLEQSDTEKNCVIPLYIINASKCIDTILK